MPELQSNFLQSTTDRAYSAIVWQDCRLDALRDGIGDGNSAVIVEDDFDTFYGTGNKYNIVGTSATCVPILTTPVGVVNLACTNSQNGQAYLVGGIALGACCSIISASPNRLWFEARVKVSDITNGAYFIGLAKASDVAAGFMADSTEAMASTANYIGFKTAQATPSKLDIVYGKAAAATVYATAAATLLTTTWVKLGIRFDGTYKTGSNLIHFYINGVEIAQDTTNALGVAASATNIPNSVGFEPTFGCKTNASAALTLSIDRYRVVNTINDSTFSQP